MDIRNILCTMFVASLMATMSSCNDSNSVENIYERAEAAFTQGDYTLAQHIIDSIPEADPQAIHTIRLGMDLNRRIIIARNRQNIAYIDSILPEMKATLQELFTQFVEIYDPTYCSDTLYRHRSDRYAGIIDRSCLRIEFSAGGQMRVISTYCGTEPLQHTSIKVELPDGTYALSPTIAYDGMRNYRFVLPDGKYCESICYTGYELRPMIEAIATAGNRQIKISYAGNEPYSYIMTAEEQYTFEMCHNYLALRHTISRIERNRKQMQNTIDLLENQSKIVHTP